MRGYARWARAAVAALAASALALGARAPLALAEEEPLVVAAEEGAWEGRIEAADGAEAVLEVADARVGGGGEAAGAGEGPGLHAAAETGPAACRAHGQARPLPEEPAAPGVRWETRDVYGEEWVITSRYWGCTGRDSTGFRYELWGDCRHEEIDFERDVYYDANDKVCDKDEYEKSYHRLYNRLSDMLVTKFEGSGEYIWNFTTPYEKVVSMGLRKVKVGTKRVWVGSYGSRKAYDRLMSMLHVQLLWKRDMILSGNGRRVKGIDMTLRKV